MERKFEKWEHCISFLHGFVFPCFQNRAHIAFPLLSAGGRETLGTRLSFSDFLLPLFDAQPII